MKYLAFMFAVVAFSVCENMDSQSRTAAGALAPPHGYAELCCSKWGEAKHFLEAD